MSTFDSVLFLLLGQTGVAAYDLNNSGSVDSSDLSKTLAGSRVNAVSVAFGGVNVDQGLQAQNPNADGSGDFLGRIQRPTALPQGVSYSAVAANFEPEPAAAATRPRATRRG